MYSKKKIKESYPATKALHYTAFKGPVLTQITVFVAPQPGAQIFVGKRHCVHMVQRHIYKTKSSMIAQ